MEKINSYFTEQQVKALRQIKEETGRTIAELLREAVEVYLKEYRIVRTAKNRGR